MIPRYSRPEMAAIWSPETRFRIWFEIEAHAADAMAELGIVPKAAAKKVWEKGRKATFDIARIDEIEREVKHDVIAFLTHLSEIVGPEARFVHSGMTSSRRARHLLQRATGARRRHPDRRRRSGAQGAQAPRLRVQADADGRSLPWHPRGADHVRAEARLCVRRVLARQGAAGRRAGRGRHLRDLGRGRHLRAGRPARRGACRQGDGTGGRAGVHPDHPARPSRHVFRHARRGRLLRRAAVDRDPPSAAHRGARGRGVFLARARRARRRCRTSATRC